MPVTAPDGPGAAFVPRVRCARCRRPARVCWCEGLAPVATRTHVVLLQHPREARRHVGTCRIVQLGIAGAEHRVGVHFDDDPRVRALAAQPGTAVLFPGPGSRPPAEVAPRTLIVVDGTWSEAGKVLRRSAVLGALPRVGLAPATPGRYRIRREPAAHCLATVEAVVDVLGALEGDGARFTALIDAFDRLVERQLDHAAARPWTHERRRRGPRSVADRVAQELEAVWPRLVVAHAEASPRAGGSDLLQLVAVRPQSGARLAAVVATPTPPDPRTLQHTGLDAAALATAEPPDAFAARWRAFAGPDAVVATWGRFAATLLGVPRGPGLVDLRAAAARAAGRRQGGIVDTATALGAALPAPWAPGRAGSRAAALLALARTLARIP